VLDALAVFLDKFIDLGLHDFVPATHERDFGVPALDHDGIHAGFVASHILRGPDDFESKDFREEVFTGGKVLNAEGHMINAHGLLHKIALLSNKHSRERVDHRVRVVSITNKIYDSI
jgi:hypothetical protein